MWCECCGRGVAQEECKFKELPETGDGWFEIIHKNCGLVFEAHVKTDFYLERPNERQCDKPIPPNPFVPLLII